MNKALIILLAVIVIIILGGISLGILYSHLPGHNPPVELNNKQQVEKLLVQKFNQPLYNNEMNIQKENDNYIVGQASVGEGGILVMAAKVNKIWELVYTGNAFADCYELHKYSFPSEFLPEYCD